jgi:hypothetical protein
MKTTLLLVMLAAVAHAGPKADMEQSRRQIQQMEADSAFRRAWADRINKDFERREDQKQRERIHKEATEQRERIHKEETEQRKVIADGIISSPRYIPYSPAPINPNIYLK